MRQLAGRAPRPPPLVSRVDTKDTPHDSVICPTYRCQTVKEVTDPEILWNEVTAHMEAFHAAQDILVSLNTVSPARGLPRGGPGVSGG